MHPKHKSSRLNSRKYTQAMALSTRKRKAFDVVSTPLETVPASLTRFDSADVDLGATTGYTFGADGVIKSVADGSPFAFVDQVSP